MGAPKFISPRLRRVMRKNHWTLTYTITVQRMKDLSTFLRALYYSGEWWKLMISAGQPADGHWSRIGITRDRKGRLVIEDLSALGIIAHECVARGMQLYSDQIRYGYAEKDFTSGLIKEHHDDIERSFSKTMAHIDEIVTLRSDIKKSRQGRIIADRKLRLYIDLAQYLIKHRFIEPRDSSKLAGHIRSFLKTDSYYQKYQPIRILNSFRIWKKRHRYSIRKIAEMTD